LHNITYDLKPSESMRITNLANEMMERTWNTLFTQNHQRNHYLSASCVFFMLLPPSPYSS
jgi:hypothetical protein